MLFEMQLFDLPLQWLAQLALAKNHQMRIGDFAQNMRHRVDEMLLPFVRHQRGDVDEDRRPMRKPILGVNIDGGQPLDLRDIDAVVDHMNPRGWNTVTLEDVVNGTRRGDEQIHLPVLPSRKGMRLQVKVDAAGSDKRRLRHRRAIRHGESGHGDGMGVVRVNDFRLELSNDARKLPRSGEVDLVARSERHKVRTLHRAPVELALRMRDEHRFVFERAQTEDGQEDLVLSPAPGARGIDVEGEHSSQSFANLRLT